jgi:DNA-binding MarR family transcriptional regulator
VSNCVVWKIRRAARVLTRIYDEALAPCGLTSTQLGTLDALSDRGQATLAQLAEAGGYERSATWRGLQPLMRRGLVERVAPEARADRYAISPAGAALLEEALVHWRRVQGEISGLLGEDVDHLNAMIEKLETAGT